MEKCAQLSENDFWDFEGKPDFGNSPHIPIERYRFDPSKERLRGLFDQVIVSFLREKYGHKSIIRPTPVLCGNGRPVDLFKLFWVVRKIGGYDAVTVNSLWGFVLEECGLYRGLVPSLKLIYRQYLDQFDRWLGHGGRDCDDGKSFVEKLDSFYRDLKNKHEYAKNRVEENDTERVGSNDGSDCCVLPPSPSAKRVSENSGICGNDDERLRVGNDFDESLVKEIATREENEPVNSRKRKREPRSWKGMLSWLKNTAKKSGDPSIGKLPAKSEWMQALLARESLLVRRNTSANEDEEAPKDNSSKKPPMYEDRFPPHKVLRSSRISSTRSHICSCCFSGEEQQSNPIKPREETSTESTRKSNEPETSPVPEKPVSIGPQFQAEIPEPTGGDTSDKWLGEKLWPPQETGNKKASVVALNPVGKGRQRTPCDCPFPGSVECVRLHIAEKKLSLKRELGTVFYLWRFDRMGEEVSLSWTAEEEEIFKDIVRSCRAFSKGFWDEVSRLLRNKTRRRIVRYYFDVYLVQRRSYQNRVTPREIDSDDDERECGSVGAGFGYGALGNPGSRLVTGCAANTRATEFS